MLTMKNLKVLLNDEELEFVKWLAERNGESIDVTLRMMLYHGLQSQMDSYVLELEGARG